MSDKGLISKFYKEIQNPVTKTNKQKENSLNEQDRPLEFQQQKQISIDKNDQDEKEWETTRKIRFGLVSSLLLV